MLSRKDIKHMLGALFMAASIPIFSINQTPISAQRNQELPIYIKSGNGVLEIAASVPSSTKTVQQALEELNLPQKDSKTFPALETSVYPNMTIVILEKHAISVIDGSSAQNNITTAAKNVSEALSENRIALGPKDLVSPDLNFVITEGMQIKITRVTQEEKTIVKDIAFPIKISNDPNMPFGRQKVLQKGVLGKAEQKVLELMQNGEVVKTTVESQNVLTQPVPELLARGTKISVGQTINGLASWYYFKNGNFAASTMFPKGTSLRVTNQQNGAQIIVMVNDYGPFAKGRIIDLDKHAFKQIAGLSQGVIPVKVEQIL